MQTATMWIQRRPATTSLIIFFTAWYGLELAVFHTLSNSTAHWWFYFEQPPRHISPGILLAPISHDLYTLTHIGANVALLFLAGSVAEPYLGWKRVLTLVLGFAYLSTYLANLTSPLYKLWIMAGASGGILALWSYSGLRLAGQAWSQSADGPNSIRDTVETIGMMALFVGTPVFLYHQAIWIPQLHSGHVIGLLLGCLSFVLETVVRIVEIIEWRTIGFGRRR